MNEKRKGEVAYALLKRHIVEATSLKSIASVRRDIGNIAKETDISADELLLFLANILREVFEEQMSAGFALRVRVADPDQ